MVLVYRSAGNYSCSRTEKSDKKALEGQDSKIYEVEPDTKTVAESVSTSSIFNKVFEEELNSFVCCFKWPLDVVISTSLVLSTIPPLVVPPLVEMGSLAISKTNDKFSL